MNTPDLTFYRLAHRRMRQSSRELAAAVASLREDDRRQQGRHLVRWYAGFEGELHVHHTVEDTIFFPALFSEVPSLRGHLDRIEDEHHHLDELIADTRTALAALADPTRAFTDALDGAASTTAALAGLLDGHLDFEDAEILPLFTRHMDRDEYKALEDAAIGRPDLSQLRFTVPWVMAGADPDEQEHMLDSSPFVMKLVWIATRRGFAKLEAAALGAAVTRPMAVSA